MKGWWDYWPGDPVNIGPLTVYPAEPHNTGVLDPGGNPVYRSPQPMGFLTAEVLADRPRAGCRIRRVRLK